MAATKNERKALNIAMIVLAAIVVVAGVVFFLMIRGGQGSSSPFVVSSKVGYANIERSGISYTLDEGTALQEGDVVETLAGSEIGVKGSGESTLYLADASRMKVGAAEAAQSKTGVELASGCLFVDARGSGGPLAVQGAGTGWTADDAVFVADVRTSTATLQVLSGKVTSSSDGEVVQAGESRTIVSASEDSGNAESAASSRSGASKSNGKLTIGSLESFALEHALDAAKAGRNLVFSADEIAGEIDRRDNERREQTETAAEDAQPVSGSVDQPEGSGETAGSSNGGTADASNGAAAAPAAGNGDSKSGSVQGASEAASSGNVQASKALTCTIQIRCDTILDNMKSLADGKSKYVPKDGVILKGTSMTFKEGESAFDVLKRVCEGKKIALVYSYAPVYSSYYVEGIGNLYEYDCGDESGWMFKVNGWFPNYGCSKYTLTDGDAIVFCYTCHGLGEDVGA